jgi:anti-sigma factor RsiW
VTDGKLCAAFCEDYSALIDGELAPARAAEVRAHIDACPACRARLASLRRVDRSLAELSPPALPADLRTRLQSRIERPGARPLGRRAPGGRRRWLAAPAAAAAAAAAAAILYLAPGEPEPSAVVARNATAPSSPEIAGADGVPEVLPLGIESVEDLDVIANLELLEAFVALDGGTG